MKKYLLAAAAVALMAPAAHAITIDQTESLNVGFDPTELNATLNFGGYTGTGTVSQVDVTYFGEVESDVTLVNLSTEPNSFSGTTVTEFAFTSSVGNSTFDTAAGTGTQTVPGGGTPVFPVTGSNTDFRQFFGAGVNPFLTPFSIDLDTDTFVRINGGGGQAFGGQSTEAFGEVTVEYLIEDISTVPLPAAAWMLLAGLGSLWAFRRRTHA